MIVYHTSVPHSARIWNYWLGGKDNFAVDRAAGDEYMHAFPGVVDVARASRQFLIRSVKYLAGEAGIRQFLDVGTGLPTEDNTHEVAQRIAPDSRIVYVDNDPMVLAHARSLLIGTPQGASAYVDADLRDPERILAEAASLLDFSRPVGLILSGIMGHVPDTGEAQAIVRRATTTPARCRTRCGPRMRSAASSTASTSWSPAWSPARSGGRTMTRPARRRSTRSVG